MGGALEVSRVRAKHVFGGCGEVIANIFCQVIKLFLRASKGHVGRLGKGDRVLIKLHCACGEECVEHGAGVHILADLTGEAFKAGGVTCARQRLGFAIVTVIGVRLPERDQPCERVWLRGLVLKGTQASDVAALKPCHHGEAAISDFAI